MPSASRAAPTARLRNNILWVEAGYDLYVTPDSQVGFNSDYNLLYQGLGPNAFIGFWNNVTRIR